MLLRQKIFVSVLAFSTLCFGALADTSPAQAGMFDMMNPSRWFNDNDRYDRDYRYGRGYGYGYGPYGGGWGGPYGGGWGGPYGGGWGGPYGGWGGGYPGLYGGYPYGGVPVTGTTEEAEPKLPE